MSFLSFTHFIAAEFSEIFEYKNWIGVAMNSFGTEFQNFPKRGHLLQNYIFRVWGHTSGARAPALAFKSTANLNIASYSRMGGAPIGAGDMTPHF